MAQEDYHGVVYRNNGDVIHGIIIDYKPGEPIMIQTSNKDVFVFSLDEIESITKEQSLTPFYSYISKISLLKRDHSYLFNINIFNSIRYSQYLAIGSGIGYDSYPNGTGIPLFIDIRVCPQEGPISPIVFADFGYSLLWIKKVERSVYCGLMTNVGFGLRFRNSGLTSFIIEVGFKHQKAKEYYPIYYIPYSDSYIYKTRYVFYDLLSFSIGVSFGFDVRSSPF